MLRFQLFLITLIPIAFLCLAMTAVVVWQSQNLSRALSTQVESRMLEDREDALRNYAQIAQTAISPYVVASQTPQGETSLSQLQQQAKGVLNSMTFGEDGYFYVYDYQGTNLVHPRINNLVGQDLWNLEDPQGRQVIQGLIAQAQNGGGYFSYIWNKPSTNLDTSKVGYAVGINDWSWMLGTGLYLDDLETESAAISGTINDIVGSAVRWMLLFALSAVAVAGLIVYAFQLRLQARANGQLQALNRRIVDIQEIQAKRISQDLHDGVSQSLVLARFSIEAVENGLGEKNKKSQAILNRARTNLDQALDELRQVARSLRPPALDQLGLQEALLSLIADFESQSALKIRAKVRAFGTGLSDFSKTALFRVAQEALTNITKHAGAKQVELSLFENEGRAHLIISDDGSGMPAQAPRGFGLQNMAERLQSLGGHMSVDPREHGGTVLSGWVPLEAS